MIRVTLIHSRTSVIYGYVHASVFVCGLTRVLKQQYSLDHIPTLFVATKSDLDLALQVSTVDDATLADVHLVNSGTRSSLTCTADGLVSRFQLQ